MTSPWHIASDRKAQLAMVGELLKTYDRAVYVGATYIKGGPKGLPLVRAHAKHVDCWEINRPCVDTIAPLGWFDDIACVDVVDAVRNGWLNQYGLLFWYHGPEHLTYARSIGVLSEMLRCEQTALVIGCPFGIYVQQATEGNPYNEHVSWFLPDDFYRLGYNVSICGKVGGSHAGILSWRIP